MAELAEVVKQLRNVSPFLVTDEMFQSISSAIWNYNFRLCASLDIFGNRVVRIAYNGPTYIYIGEIEAYMMSEMMQQHEDGRAYSVSMNVVRYSVDDSAWSNYLKTVIPKVTTMEPLGDYGRICMFPNDYVYSTSLSVKTTQVTNADDLVGTVVRMVKQYLNAVDEFYKFLDMTIGGLKGHRVDMLNDSAYMASLTDPLVSACKIKSASEDLLTEMLGDILMEIIEKSETSIL